MKRTLKVAVIDSVMNTDLMAIEPDRMLRRVKKRLVFFFEGFDFLSICTTLTFARHSHTGGYETEKNRVF